MSQHQRILLLVLAVLIIQSTMVPSVSSQVDPPGLDRALFEVGRFTYRASFQLDDGTEVFLIRSSYQVTFLYQHHQPVIRQHFFSASLGFYFGKTMLGRSIAQSVEFDSFAFYPKWFSSGGISHDLIGETSVIELEESVNDGQLAYGMLLIDQLAVTQYLPMYGGTFVFTNLIITLDDGSVIDFGDDPLQIEVEMQDKEYVPEDAILQGGGDPTYDFEPRIININTGALVPLIVYLDTIVGYFLIGAGILLLGLIILHIKGRIVLPFDRMKGALSRTAPEIVN